jgi:hypothetical protein
MEKYLANKAKGEGKELKNRSIMRTTLTAVHHSCFNFRSPSSSDCFGTSAPCISASAHTTPGWQEGNQAEQGKEGTVKATDR